jgi:hypothetical protein
MRNNSKTRQQQRRDNARVSLIRTREMHLATFEDERTTEKTKDQAALQIIRIDRELEALGVK